MISTRSRRLVLAISAFALGFPSPSVNASVDLHAHVFMEHAMTYAFRGDFESPLRARDWTARMESQINADAVNRSGVRLLVASLYAHPLFRVDLRQAVRDQIDAAERFVAAHPDWILARDPRQARDALAAGKRVLVLSLEGAAGILEEPVDFEEFLDRRGIRIVTPLHLTDDRFGGAAFMRGILKSFNPLAMLRSLFHPVRDETGLRINDRGLTPRGVELVNRLIQHRVWVDLSHASDRSLEGILPILREAGQPLLYTHTVLRRYHGAERGLAPAQIEQIAASQGIVGLMPSQDYLEGTDAELPGGCDRGMGLFARQYRDLGDRLGASRVMNGSDFNGGVRHLPQGCAAGTNIDQEGFWNFGQTSELMRSLVLRGAAPANYADAAVQAFLDAWERADGSR